jgi:tRNA/rRNA methyltransferase
VGTKKKKELRARQGQSGAVPGTPKHKPKPVQRGGGRFRVVLVSPEIPGNLGFVARVMANFGVESLKLVGGCEITEEARDRAVHAQQILDGAKRVKTLKQALRGTSLAVGSTSILALPDKSLWRNPETLRDIVPVVQSAEGTVALVFGRESRGLLNKELAQLDIVFTIPTNDAYPSLNVSHALAVALYELSGAVRDVAHPEVATAAERGALLRRFDELERAARTPAARIARNRVMLRRVIARAGLSKWEFHAISGVLARPAKQLRRDGAERRARGAAKRRTRR